VFSLLSKEGKEKAEELNHNLFLIRLKLEWEEMIFIYIKAKSNGYKLAGIIKSKEETKERKNKTKNWN
jgi:hypothetical protein